jgi:Outer membrane protein beta-barrel domain
MRFSAIFVAIILLGWQTAEAGYLMARGIKLGITAADMYGVDIDDPFVDSRVGIMTGGFAVWRLSPLFAVQSEVLLTLKGATLRDMTPYQTFKLTYLEIPLLAKLVLPTTGPVTPNMFIGPFAAYSLSARRQIDVNDAPAAELNHFDAGFVLGLGVDFAMASRMWLIEIRYDMSMMRVDDSPAKQDLKNRVITIAAGYAW